MKSAQVAALAALTGGQATADGIVAEVQAMVASIEALKLILGADCLQGVIEEARAQVELSERQSDLLTRAAGVLRGDPPEGVAWSHADVPQLCQDAMDAIRDAEPLVRSLIPGTGSVVHDTDHVRDVQARMEGVLGD